ncbi:hypothetical protein [Achromobacter pestifer]|uniref:Uncharacterized protein n=1 Tax=Achromobacter pestifer TaxID=1353889 RepID=A0A6S6Z6A8_9BURK|nr:hypothetical protein [Achromobacter pestifer]CAB3657018.1 hypothetical protein LMG3431_03159 [Achromobacter pestifer]
MRFSFQRAVLACLCGTLLTACTTWDIALARQKGRPVNDLVAEWGPPNKVYASDELPIGQLVYLYSTADNVEWNEAVGSYGNFNYGGTIYQRRSGVANCYTSFFVDENGIIVGGNLENEGVRCKMW